jgi:hypothetical protein
MASIQSACDALIPEDPFDQFKVFCTIDNMCHDLGFDIFDITEDLTLLDYREKRDQLKIRDVFNSLQDFKDSPIRAVQEKAIIRETRSALRQESSKSVYFIVVLLLLFLFIYYFSRYDSSKTL